MAYQWEIWVKILFEKAHFYMFGQLYPSPGTSHNSPRSLYQWDELSGSRIPYLKPVKQQTWIFLFLSSYHIICYFLCNCVAHWPLCCVYWILFQVKWGSAKTWHSKKNVLGCQVRYQLYAVDIENRLLHGHTTVSLL